MYQNCSPKKWLDIATQEVSIFRHLFLYVAINGYI